MIKKLVQSFLLQLMFLTRFPVPFKVAYDPLLAARGMVCAPLTGTLLGLVYAGVYWCLAAITTPLIACAGVLTADLVLTGGLHYDGLADSCDGLFSGRDRERILEIMRDSRIGTNGTLALIFAVVWKAALLISLPADCVMGALIIAPTAGRLAIIWASGLGNYARSGPGMGEHTAKLTGIREIVIATISAGIVLSIVGGVYGLPVLAAVVLFSLVALWYVNKKIGGVTGDILGGLIELGELVALGAFFIIEKYGVTV